MRSMVKVGGWIGLSILLDIFIFSKFGIKSGFQYLGCYITELSLSLDNLLMFYIIFKYFKVSAEQQNKILNIGIMSAYVLRFIMIFSGSILIHKFAGVSYLFAAFLIYSAVQIFRTQEEDKEPKKLINFVEQNIPFLSLTALIVIVIEITDLMFAVDSVPAAFGITKNPLIIFAANVLAIGSLRSLYFVMLDMIKRFSWLDKLIAVILFSTGVKFLIWG